MSSSPSAAKQIFLEAIEQHAPDRWPSFLDQACGDDAPLRQRVETLLEAHADGNSLLDHPAMAPAATSDRPITEQPGTMIGPYKLVEEIGEGGMGVVYMAEQTEPVERRVALKIIKPGMDSKQVVRRFEAERQALAIMDHPSIAKVLEAGATETGRPYFVMELVQGVPITEHCDEHNLTTNERLELFTDVCRAIQHAHLKGIIHRDIKPTNVMVALIDGRPVPKVIDFGIAKAIQKRLAEKTFFTGDGQFLGTPQYMSPEQAGMSDLDVDIRTDVYSLGVLLYELLVGSTPFDPEQLRQAGYDEICRIIRETDPPTPSKHLSTLGAAIAEVSKHRQAQPAALRKLMRGDLDCIVMKALEKDRDDRYDTAQALADDLRRHLQDKPIQATKPSLAQRVFKWSRRHKPVVWSAVATLIVGFVAFAASTVLIASAYENERQQRIETHKALQLAEEQQRLAEQQKELAEEQKKEAIKQQQEIARQRDATYQNLYVARIRLAQQDWESGRVAGLRDVLDQYLPQPGRADLRGWEWYYLLSLCYRDLMTLRGHSASINSVAWSPDGLRLASAGVLGNIIIWNPDSGKKVRTLHGSPINALAWSPDSRRLAAAGESAIRFWAPESGRKQLGISTGAPQVRSIAWSPDGKRLASPGADKTVAIWDATTGKKVRTLAGHVTELLNVAWSPDGRRLAASGNEPNTITVWDAESGEIQTTLKGSSFISHLAWNPESTRLLSSDAGGKVSVWDPVGRRELFSMVHGGP
ncbi:MAG: protein kinase [Pirellulaceae bacterium]